MSEDNAPPSVIKRLLNTVNTNRNNIDEYSSEASTKSKITTVATPLPDKKRLEESWKAVEEIINRQQQQTTPAWKIQATLATTTTSPPRRSSPGGRSTPGSVKKALAVSFPTSHRVTSSSTDEGLAATSMVWMKQLADIYNTTSGTPSTSSGSCNSTAEADTGDRQCDTCQVVATSTPVIIATTKHVPVADAPKMTTIPSPAAAATPAAAPVVAVRVSSNVLPTSKTTPPASRPPVAPSPTVLKSKQQQQRLKHKQGTFTNNIYGLQLSQKLVAFTLKLCIMLFTVWMVTTTMTTHPTLGMSSSKTHFIAGALRNVVPQGLKNIPMLNTKGIFRNNNAPYFQFQEQMWRPWEKKKNTLVVVVGGLSTGNSFVPASLSAHLKKVWSYPVSSLPAFETEQGMKIGFNPVGNNGGGVEVEVEKKEIVRSWGTSKLALSEFHIHVQEVIVAALKKVFNTLGQTLQLARVRVGQQRIRRN